MRLHASAPPTMRFLQDEFGCEVIRSAEYAAFGDAGVGVDVPPVDVPHSMSPPAQRSLRRSVQVVGDVVGLRSIRVLSQPLKSIRMLRMLRTLRLRRWSRERYKISKSGCQLKNVIYISICVEICRAE